MPKANGDLRARVRSSALVKNPVLFEAIGIAPVAAMAVSLKSAIMLAAVSGVELLFIELFACLALKRLKSYFRVPIYAVLGIGVNIPLFLFFEHFTPNETNSAGIFLPLLAVNSLVALHCERFAVKNSLKNTLIDALSAAVGYAAVVLTVGAVREILGSGTLYSAPLYLPVQLSGFLLPFGGLLLLGFFAAAIKAVIAKRCPDEDTEAAFDLREVSQSHIGHFKTLLDAEFDPYDEGAASAPSNANTSADRLKKRGRHKAKKAAPQQTAQVSSVPEQTVQEPRKAREDYLLDFDEILTELDAYKQTKEDTAAAPPAEAAEEAPQTQQDIEKDAAEEDGEV